MVNSVLKSDPVSVYKSAQLVSQGPYNQVYFIQTVQGNFYCKHYFKGGRSWLRQWTTLSRARKEKNNLEFFKTLGIPTATIVDYQEKSSLGYFKEATLLLDEIPQVFNLKAIAQTYSEWLKNRSWRLDLIRQLAHYTRLMHQQGFIHIDLKWRNILATLENTPKIYFIDCPSGYFARLFKKRGYIKDLACLLKGSIGSIRNTDKLRFYYAYQNIQKLNPTHKKQIRQIVRFFM